MNKTYLTLSDLKENGLVLSKNDAAELAPLIREVSHNGGDDENIIYPGPKAETDDQAPVDNNIGEYLTEQEEKNLMSNIGITEENTPAEYYAAILNLIDRTVGNIKLKLQNKLKSLEILMKPADDISESILNDPNTAFNAPAADSVPSTEDNKEDGESNQTNSTGSADVNAADNTDNAEDLEDINPNDTPEEKEKKEHYKTKLKRLKDNNLEERPVTQEDIDANPLAGWKVGDIAEFPIKAA